MQLNKVQIKTGCSFQYFFRLLINKYAHLLDPARYLLKKGIVCISANVPLRSGEEDKSKEIRTCIAYFPDIQRNPHTANLNLNHGRIELVLQILRMPGRVPVYA